MKTIKFFIISALLLTAIGCNGQNKESKKAISSDNIEVYYFHFTARCVTCNTIESELNNNIESLYAGLKKDNKISFHSINLDQESGEKLAQRLKVSGQTVLIVKGDKRILLTNEAFLYARSNPKKFKSILKEKIDSLIS